MSTNLINIGDILPVTSVPYQSIIQYTVAVIGHGHKGNPIIMGTHDMILGKRQHLVQHVASECNATSQISEFFVQS